MKILDVLDKETILIDLKSKDKIGILHELVAPAARARLGLPPPPAARLPDGSPQP